MRTWKTLLLQLALLAAFGCEEDAKNAPPPVHEEEVITTVQMVFVPMGETEEKVFTFRDEDGEGGEGPEVDSDTLSANTTYDVTVYFLNESVTPVDSLNTEINEEGDEHQVFLRFNPQLGISHSYTDADIHGDPVGLNMQVVTDTTGTSEMTLVLRHQPDKEAPDVSEGDITHAGGQTDVEVSFDVRIE